MMVMTVYKYFKTENNKVFPWESKRLSDEKISITTSNNNHKFAASLIYLNARLWVKFSGDFLKQVHVTYNHGPTVNIYIVYEITPDTKTSSITLENCLFGAPKLTKNADCNKYKYS